MKKIIIALTIFCSSILLTSCSSFFYQQSKSEFYILDPKKVHFEDLYFKTADGVRLHAWYFPAQELPNDKAEAGALFIKQKKTIKGTAIQFHGNAENITTHFASYVWMIYEGYNFIAFDYRGYGQSEGSPTQEGAYLDALAAMNVGLAKNTPLVLIGQSLGGAILLRAYEDFPQKTLVKAVVIESSFYSYQAIASDVLSRFWLTWPFQWLGKAWVSDQYTPEHSIQRVSPTPLLVMHGDHDPVIPLSFGQEIYRRAKEPKEFWLIENGGHINAMTSPIHRDFYRKKLIEYLNKI